MQAVALAWAGLQVQAICQRCMSCLKASEAPSLKRCSLRPWRGEQVTLAGVSVTQVEADAPSLHLCVILPLPTGGMSAGGLPVLASRMPTSQSFLTSFLTIQPID